MLLALHDAMIDVLKSLGTGNETIDGYEKRWSDTLEGVSRSFPCPACYAGARDSALKVLPAKSSTHHVKCLACDREYSYVEED